jgi:hypothetical protein
MRTLITVISVVLCVHLWAQATDSFDSTIIDSLYAIPELDGSLTANTAGLAFSMNATTYEFVVGDSGYPYDNCAMRAFISFPLPIIPIGYFLSNARIRLYQYRSYGIEQLEDSTYVNTFFPHWDVAGGDTIRCIVSHADYGISLGLDDWAKGDAGNPYTYNPNVGEITWEGIDEPGDHGEVGYRYLDITDCLLYDLAIGSIFSQYRIAFQINTDYDYGADFVAFKSMESNNEHQRPRIYFTLYNPSSLSDDLSPAVLVNITANPNPFSSVVTFNVNLKNSAELSVKLYDLRGRVVKQVDSRSYSRGTHNVSMETSDLSNGMYLLQVKAGSDIITKKITCLK